jgi:hypothetical protein
MAEALTCSDGFPHGLQSDRQLLELLDGLMSSMFISSSAFTFTRANVMAVLMAFSRTFGRRPWRTDLNATRS